MGIAVSFYGYVEAQEAEGLIKKIQFTAKTYATYDTSAIGMAFVYLDELPPACGDNDANRRFVISTDHALYNSVVSSALAAKASGQSIRVRYIAECNIWGNAWDFSILYVQ